MSDHIHKNRFKTKTGHIMPVFAENIEKKMEYIYNKFNTGIADFRWKVQYERGCCKSKIHNREYFCSSLFSIGGKSNEKRL